jgi:hypothetical protein
MIESLFGTISEPNVLKFKISMYLSGIYNMVRLSFTLPPLMNKSKWKGIVNVAGISVINAIYHDINE